MLLTIRPNSQLKLIVRILFNVKYAFKHYNYNKAFYEILAKNKNILKSVSRTHH